MITLVAKIMVVGMILIQLIIQADLTGADLILQIIAVMIIVGIAVDLIGVATGAATGAVHHRRQHKADDARYPHLTLAPPPPLT